MLSEAGKIDLNAADQKLLEALMLQAPVSEDSSNRDSPEERAAKLVNAIIDWRDPDDEVH